MTNMVMQLMILALVQVLLVVASVDLVAEQVASALKIFLKASLAVNQAVGQDDQMQHKEEMIYNIALISVLKRRYLVKKQPSNINVKKNVTLVMVLEQKKVLSLSLVLNVMEPVLFKSKEIHLSAA